MIGWLKAQREKIECDFTTYERKRYLSATFYGQYKTLLPLLREYAHGKLIDLGCGVMPFRNEVLHQVACYHGLDRYPRSPSIQLVGDMQEMTMIGNSSYDTAVCLEVLEHLPDPFKATDEIFRILRPGGFLIGSVPHLSRLHEEPHDYYRYTAYGLQIMLKRSGFTEIFIHKRGGIFSFLSHQISNLLVSASWGIPGLESIIWQLNKYIFTLPAYWIDTIFDQHGVFALGYVFVAQKPLPPTSHTLSACK